MPAWLDALRHRTGVVIPVYLPEGIDRAQGAALLRDNVAAFAALLADPQAICLSVDGEPASAAIIGQLQREFGVLTLVAPVNRGKLWAAAQGARRLLERTSVEFLAVADQDGADFANDLPNFVRLAQAMAAERALVLGRRASPHRSLGFLRGELEELADRVLLDALLYRAAVQGRPLRLEYTAPLAEWPDFHSGYKLFSRATAADVFLSPLQCAGLPEDACYRHACEAVAVVEALERAALLGAVNRSTLNEQPFTVFGRLRQSRVTADMILWPCRRLGVPWPFVRQWLANHTPRLRLATLAPEGKAELQEVWRLVAEGYGEAEPGPFPQPPFT